MNGTRLFLSLTCAAALSGCVVAPVSPSYGYDYGPGVGPVWVDPAVPYYGVVPGAPFVGGVWIDGTWGYDGGRRAWRPGPWNPSRPAYRGPRHRGPDGHGRPGGHRPDDAHHRGDGPHSPRTGPGRGMAPPRAGTPPAHSSGRHPDGGHVRTPDGRSRQP